MPRINKNKIPYSKLFQKRVANLSIGGTTLRNQGGGVAEKAREYLMKIDLSEFSKINKKREFKKLLDKHTKKLEKKLKLLDKRRNRWGVARKSINIFLLDASLNHYLFQKYRLDKIIPHLEVPLDSNVFKELKKDFKSLKENKILEGGLLRKLEKESSKKFTIKGLRKETSETLQGFASKVTEFQKFASEDTAKSENKIYHRVFLDLIYWRKNKKR